MEWTIVTMYNVTMDNDNICGMAYIDAAECDHFTFSNTIWPHSLSPFLRNDIKPRVHHIRDNATNIERLTLTSSSPAFTSDIL